VTTSTAPFLYIFNVLAPVLLSNARVAVMQYQVLRLRAEPCRIIVWVLKTTARSFLR
jgi:hypothetical protein